MINTLVSSLQTKNRASHPAIPGVVPFFCSSDTKVISHRPRQDDSFTGIGVLLDLALYPFEHAVTAVLLGWRSDAAIFRKKLILIA
jgi:hypothetical protein